MDARRRPRPGVTSVLLAARVGGNGRGEAFALVRRERLVLGPGLAQVLFGRRTLSLGEVLVVLARLPALLRREARPGLHAPLHALLLLRLHARVALGDRDPLLPALGLERVPVGLERREDLLLLRGELGPRRARVRLGLRRLRRGLGCGRL